MPKVSVCIPTYNRANVLGPLLDSALNQEGGDYEIVVCEDGSPERDRIRKIVADYQKRASVPIRYHENETNLGYDGNLRRLIEKAEGTYCFFMGNDDLVAPGALASVHGLVARHPDVGVVLRSYATFDDDPTRITQTFRYFNEERLFPAGPDTVATFFRRCVVISGLVLHREAALACATEAFDGTLLYQLHLAGHILARHQGVSTPDVLALYRNGGTPDFGNSASEQGRFTPREQTPESSLHFMRGMLRIAEDIERTEGLPVYRRIVRDIGNYSYPVLAIQSQRPLPAFLRYGYGLAKLGFWRNKMFYCYFAALLLLGSRRVEGLIKAIKKRLGRAPMIGDVYRGRPA